MQFKLNEWFSCICSCLIGHSVVGLTKSQYFLISRVFPLLTSGVSVRLLLFGQNFQWIIYFIKCRRSLIYKHSQIMLEENNIESGGLGSLFILKMHIWLHICQHVRAERKEGWVKNSRFGLSSGNVFMN